MGAPIGQTGIAGALTVGYVDGLFAQQFSDESYGEKAFKRGVAGKDFRWDGRVIRFATYLRRSHNFGARASGVRIPDEIRDIGTGGTAEAVRDDLTVEQAEALPSRLYARIAIDGDVIAAARSDRKRFIEVVKTKKAAAREGLARYSEFALYGDESGRLATVAAVAAAVVTVRVAGAAFPGEWGLYWLALGAFVVFINPVTNAVRGAQGHRITALDAVNNTFTVRPAPAAAVVAGDAVVEGDTNGNSWMEMPAGFERGIATAADGTRYLGISRDEHERWEGTVVAAAAAGALGDISPWLVRFACTQARRRGGLPAKVGGFHIFLPSGVWDEQAYGPLTGQGAAGGNDINANRRYNSEKMVAGVHEYTYAEPAFGEMTICDNPDGRPNTAYAVRKGAAMDAILEEWAWAKGYEGDGTFTLDGNLDRYVARIKRYFQRLFTHPSSCWKIIRLRDRPSGVTGNL